MLKDNCLGFSVHVFKEALTCARSSIEDDTFGGLDAHLLIILWMCERQLHRLLSKPTEAAPSTSGPPDQTLCTSSNLHFDGNRSRGKLRKAGTKLCQYVCLEDAQ